MQNLWNALQQLSLDFTVSTEQLFTIAEKFEAAMTDGLSGTDMTLKMLPSFLAAPTGREHGRYLAVDFGGTNVRTLIVELDGQGSLQIKKHVSRPLRDPGGSYDYLSAQATAEELFDFIAEQIAEIITDDTNYQLGHTFSFPMQQTGINSATLICWTKEIATAGVEGQDVNQLLQAALARRGLPQVTPKVILNDTVGTLLTAAYSHPGTAIGSICGTGHNTAYLEPNAPWNNGPMVINLESGNFDKLPVNSYDEQLDCASEKPGAQRLEKMISGRYIGELLQIVIQYMLAKGLLPHHTKQVSDFLAKPNRFTGADVSLLIEDQTTDLEKISAWLQKRLDVTQSTRLDREALQTIASLIATRSARLVAATFIGILHRIDPQRERKYVIAIDGSLYEKLPGYADSIHRAIAEVYQNKAHQITTILSKDGSGLGAAIAVALASTPE
ncbi:hypothetical protein P22_1029 [Propionispora sp. 2/2-37]|uniref:hexokinase family protein n=1 Tax=Propionispora sp. 2/2-37 TaxID=1677858 RepID=UPI0006BB5756|nr:hexokinase [Propionispora sp. 2/2-37]CUH94960.1 hypothetical protein P22_1029 [Propionispora sp. 2/2-37]